MSNLKKISIDVIGVAACTGMATNGDSAKVNRSVPTLAARQTLVLALLGLSVAGCVAPATKGASRGETAETIQMIAEASMAEVIVKNCPDGFRFNESADEAFVAELNATWKATAGNAVLLSEAEEDRAIDSYFDGYVLRRGIKFGNSATWCSAGKAEVAANSRTGKLLIPL